jgi:hypothetical protein
MESTTHHWLPSPVQAGGGEEDEGVTHAHTLTYRDTHFLKHTIMYEHIHTCIQTTRVHNDTY